MKKILNSKKVLIIIGFLGLFLVSTGVSLAAFTFLSGQETVNEEDTETKSKSRLDSERSKIEALPKTEICPVNGAKFTKIEKDIWKQRRPLTVVIENHVDSRPQSGLSKADVVYEAVAEGGITRFLGVFYCAAASQELRISPIRSARVYFVNWAAEYGKDPIFLHVGGANNIDRNSPGGVKIKGQVAPEVDAFSLLERLGWRKGVYGNDFDGGTNVGVPAVVRDQYRLNKDTPSAWEHSVVAYVDRIYDEAAKRNYGAKGENGDSWDENYVEWQFSDDKPVAPTAREISFEFWNNKSDYNVRWEYDPSGNVYKRFNGGKAFGDWEFGGLQIQAKNVVIQFVKERGPVDKELHMFYEVVGKGDALIFQNGQVIEAVWEKKSLTGRTKFYDNKGAEISFVRGPIWVEAVPAGNDVVYYF